MEVKHFVVRDALGNALSGGRVTIRTAGTQILATLYTQDAGGNIVAADNPYIADEHGRVTIAAADGLYDMELAQDDVAVTDPVQRIKFFDLDTSIAVGTNIVSIKTVADNMTSVLRVAQNPGNFVPEAALVFGLNSLAVGDGILVFGD